MNAREWSGFVCNKANAKVAHDTFAKAVPMIALQEENLLTMSELIAASPKCLTKAKLVSEYTTHATKDPPQRWGNLELVVGILAEVLRRK